MSGDEIFALVISGVIGVIGWWPWLGGLLGSRPFVWKRPVLVLALASPLLALIVIWFVLVTWSSHDVRSDPKYVFFYLALWFGWLGALNRLLPYAGLSGRDDLIERQNPAAGLAVGGALIGLTLAFAGGNIGDGPGWWVVVFSSGLATATLMGLWVIGNLISRVHEAISVDRDVAAGWRAAGYFIGGGLIVGRAAAGNWRSAAETTSDFLAAGWPVLLVWAVAVGADIVARPSPQCPVRPAVTFGLLPALALIALGLLLAMKQGPW